MAVASLGWATSAWPLQEAGGLTIGVGVHLSGGKRDLERSLAMLQEAGVTSFRDDAPWESVEVTPGRLVVPERWDALVDAATAKGLSPLVILDYGNRFYDRGDKPISPAAVEAFARYVEALVGHFRGRVTRYEIWNEWDNTTGHTTRGSPADYVRLVARAYERIKALDPTSQVLAGAVTAEGLRDPPAGSGFLSTAIRQGLLSHTDALSVHTYIHCRRAAAPEDWFRWMLEVQARLEELAGQRVPLYITEMGWPSLEGHCGVSELQQGRYLARLLLLARALDFVRGLWWYDLQDDGTDPSDREHHFGLVRWDMTPKPAYAAMASLAALVQQSSGLGLPVVEPDGLWKMRLRTPDREIWAVWSAEPGHCFSMAVRDTSYLQPTGRAPLGASGAEIRRPAHAAATVVAGPAPTLVWGSPGKLTLERGQAAPCPEEDSAVVHTVSLAR